jgi:hypothetical protein
LARVAQVQALAQMERTVHSQQLPLQAAVVVVITMAQQMLRQIQADLAAATEQDQVRLVLQIRVAQAVHLTALQQAAAAEQTQLVKTETVLALETAVQVLLLP